MKILIVDDEDLIVKSLTKLSLDLGLEVESCYNGQDAVNLVESGNKYGVILMDLSMPVLDGDQATLKIRGMNGGDLINIILISGDEFTEEEYKKKGYTDYAKKPVGKTVFKNLIAKYTS